VEVDADLKYTLFPFRLIGSPFRIRAFMPSLP
jgi:hypothetical protein